MLARVAARWGDRPALVDGASGEVMTHGDLRARVERVAAGLGELGVRPGDVVALQAPNGPGWMEVALGAIEAGAVATGPSHRRPADREIETPPAPTPAPRCSPRRPSSSPPPAR